MTLMITKAQAMSLYEAYKAKGLITTHQPYPMGAGGVAKFWTLNLSFVDNGEGFLVSTKSKADQTAIHKLKAYFENL